MASRSSESTPLTSSRRTPHATPPTGGPTRAKVITRLVALIGIAIVLLVGLALVNHEPTAHSSHVRSKDPSPSHLASPPFSGSTDEITALPGKPDAYTARLFSGYLPLHNGGEGFYFLAESQSENPKHDPVLLWLNGGPGSSSLAGCFSENGPLLVNDDGKTLRVNDFAWNKNANMLCVESPIGVGFTYNASGVYKSSDVAQADDLYWMLQAFFDKFPWLRANDFVISGESYGGVYVPMTAKRIVEGNQQNETATHINLKKFVVGNGVNEFTRFSMVAFAYYHGLISTDAYVSVDAACPGLLVPGATLPSDVSDACESAIGAVSEELQGGNVNNYNIYAPCPGGDGMAGFTSMIEDLTGPLQDVPHPVRMSVSACLDWSELQSFFNQPDVRSALHTKPEVAQWNSVSLTSANFDLASVLNKTAEEIEMIIQNKVLQYDMTQHMTVTPIWKFLLNNGVQGLIYHGDVDMACDFIGGLWAVESLNLPRKQPRATWTVKDDDQTAGFVEDFGLLKYVTVKGSGHMVPTDKPKEAKAMLDQFVFDQ